MITILADVGVQVFGKQISDPDLQLVGLAAFAPFFLGVMAIVLASRMIAADSKARPTTSEALRSLSALSRKLTPAGTKMRSVGFGLVGLGMTMFAYIYFRAR